VEDHEESLDLTESRGSLPPLDASMALRTPYRKEGRMRKESEGKEKRERGHT